MRKPRRKRAAAIVRRFQLQLCWVAFGVALTAATARAQTTVPKNYRIDLFGGPITGPNRVISLGGAYTALGYGIDNASTTPAAYAARTMWDLNWFEWDVTVDYSPDILRQIRINNIGLGGASNNDISYLTLGGSAMAGEIGVGGLLRRQAYRIGDSAQFELIAGNFGACYSLLEGQLLVGAAARTAALTITNAQTREVLVSFTGVGPEVGAIFGPADQPYRIGIAARSAVESGANTSARSGLGLTLPRAVSLPAEVQLGMAYQLGSRPLNRRWVNPHDRERELRNELLARRLQRQREQARREYAPREPGAPTEPLWLQEPHDPAFWALEGERMAQEEQQLTEAIARAESRRRQALRALPRNYLLLSADVQLVGTTQNGAGIESFLGAPRPAGANPSLSFRLGAEGEPIQNRVKLRAGTYLEPSRVTDVAPRLHATMGADVKLFTWDLFGLLERFELRVSAALDVAERYRNFGGSIGIWH